MTTCNSKLLTITSATTSRPLSSAKTRLTMTLRLRPTNKETPTLQWLPNAEKSTKSLSSTQESFAQGKWVSCTAATFDRGSRAHRASVHTCSDPLIPSRSSWQGLKSFWSTYLLSVHDGPEILLMDVFFYKQQKKKCIQRKNDVWNIYMYWPSRWSLRQSPIESLLTACHRSVSLSLSLPRHVNILVCEVTEWPSPQCFFYTGSWLTEICICCKLHPTTDETCDRQITLPTTFTLLFFCTSGILHTRYICAIF